MNDIVIQTEAVTRTYITGTNEVQAVRGIDLAVRNVSSRLNAGRGQPLPAAIAHQ